MKPLRTSGSVQFRQGARGVPGAPEAGDRFGAALAGGGNVIGAPGEDVGRVVDAGIVVWRLTRAIEYLACLNIDRVSLGLRQRRRGDQCR